MPTTTIEVSVENYQWLSGQKRPGDSFNDVLDRIRIGFENNPSAPDQSAEENLAEATFEKRFRERHELPDESIGGDDVIAVAQLIREGLDRAEAFQRRADEREIGSSTVRANCLRHTNTDSTAEFEQLVRDLIEES